MAYKNIFKDVLKTNKIDKTKRDFELSHTVKMDKGNLTQNPRNMTIEQISDYITVNYTNKKTILKKDLIKDLVEFKSYKEYLEIAIEESSFLFNYFGIIISLYASLFAMSVTSDKTYEKFSISIFPLNIIFGEIEKTGLSKSSIELGLMLVLSLGISLVFAFIKTDKKSSSNRLKTVDNAVFILEAIKDDMYNNPDCHIEKFKRKRRRHQRIWFDD